MKRHQEACFLQISLHVKTYQEGAVSQPGRGPYAGTLFLVFQPRNRNWEVTICCLNHTACCLLLQYPEQNNTTVKTFPSKDNLCLLLLAYPAAILTVLKVSGLCLLYLNMLGLSPTF